MRKVTAAVSFLLILFLTVSVAAAAGTAMSPEDGALLDLAKPVFDAIMHGQWWLAASLVLVLLVAAFKKYAPGKLGEWARGDVGGSLLVLLGSYGGAMATGLLAAGTGALSPALAWVALKVAIAASGGYTLLKKLVMPFIRKLAEVVPAWMKPIFTMVLWAFDRATPVESAEKAGDAAVAEKPAGGANGVVGSATDL
jgi:hypothetical protein